MQAILDKAAKQPEKKQSAKGRKPRYGQLAKEFNVPAAEFSERKASARRPVREGTRFVGAHVKPEVLRQLKLIAVEDDMTVQDEILEALDLLFVKRGKDKIAKL
jgi:hypothetical protein